MNLPPSLMYVKVRDDGNEGFGIWLPLFLLWPLILMFLVLAFVITIAADFILFIMNVTYHRYSLLLFGAVVASFQIKRAKCKYQKRKS